MELTIEQALQQGVAAHKEGKLQDAERLYRAILQSQPGHPDANHNLGVLAVSVNKAEAALPLFKVALEANPKIEQFWLSYIDVLIKEQQFDNAKQVIEDAKKQGVAGEKLNVLKAQLLSKTDSANINPPQELINKLLDYYQSRKFVEAETLCKEITQGYPKHPFAWKALGAVLQATGRQTEAAAANQAAIVLSPEDAEAHSNLGNTLQDLARLEDAETSYNQAIALKPDYAEAHYNMGVTFKELGRLEKAEASYAQAIVLQPDFAEAHYNLGITLKDLGRLEEAKASYAKAIAFKPEYSSAKHLLAALSGETTTTAPRDYVEELFNNYAARFESSLVDNLDYKIPKVITELIIKRYKAESLGSIIDLGCGSGLLKRRNSRILRLS